MVSQYSRIAWILAASLLATPAGWVVAVENGDPDGNAHPSVADLIRLDPDACDELILGCNAVLISPTVAVTTAACARTIGAPNLIPPGVLSFNPDNMLLCSGLVRVQASYVHPGYDQGIPGTNVGVLVLASPAPGTPAALPAAGSLDALSGDQRFVAVGSGADHNGNQAYTTGVTSRRFALAEQWLLDPDTLTIRLEGAARPCNLPINAGAGAFLASTGDLVGIALPPADGCTKSPSYQRLDTAIVRDFLAGFVTLP